ncbi:SDR family NAD(P)-dependent oxidoreductase [Terrarubrum flagellatum]|uniref:SDR family NAD(P)-dependent oxidoreductase n=1 Tax=Terrirubrum flagellatum TaxID=2895980 RepID=UPI0031450C6C
MNMDQATALSGKVAVITGAASGIGLALALHAARLGMKVALSDVSDDRLSIARTQVEALGAQAIAVRADVSKFGDVEQLRDRAERELGAPWLVANNAGITKIALTWSHSAADWRRMFDINLYGVVNGLLAFLPGLRARRSGYILNTASAAGLLTIPAASAYVASKHAVVGLSETLYRELSASRSGVSVSVLCPALVKTNIMQSSDAAGAGSAMQSSHAMSPEDVAVQVFDAIAAKRFWILTHAAHMEPYIRARAEQMVTQENPDLSSADPDVARSSSAATGVDFLAAPSA